MKKIIACLTMLFLLFSCVSQPKATEDDFSRIFTQDMRDVFHAVRTTFAELGCEITRGNLKSESLSARRYELFGMCMFYKAKFSDDSSSTNILVTVDIYLRNCDAIVALPARAYKSDFDEFWEAVEANL